MGLKGMSGNHQDSRFPWEVSAQTEARARGTVAEGRARADAERVPGHRRPGACVCGLSPELPASPPGEVAD